MPSDICSTRTVAERRAAEKLQQLGINSIQHFIEATFIITFKAQGEIWLKSLASRKRNSVEQTTIDTRRYAVDEWTYPFFEKKLVADVNNLTMKQFVEHISALPPAAIRDYSNIVKFVVPRPSMREVSKDSLGRGTRNSSTRRWLSIRTSRAQISGEWKAF
jgi:hypothetical protein